MSKPRANPKLKGVGSAALALAITQAKKALENPETRKAIIEQGRTITGSVRNWQRDRQGDSTDDAESSPRRGISEVVTSTFGQGKLEARVENLRTSVDTLGQGRPDLASALAPVLDSVEKIAVSLQLAGSLPVLKRKAAHRQIGKALDDLEVGLFQASLPDSTG